MEEEKKEYFIGRIITGETVVGIKDKKKEIIDNPCIVTISRGIPLANPGMVLLQPYIVRGKNTLAIGVIREEFKQDADDIKNIIKAYQEIDKYSKSQIAKPTVHETMNINKDDKIIDLSKITKKDIH